MAVLEEHWDFLVIKYHLTVKYEPIIDINTNRNAVIKIQKFKKKYLFRGCSNLL